MRVSLEGMLHNIESALRSSRDSHACMLAYCLMEMGDNLRKVANGEATADEFFALYVTPKGGTPWADNVHKKNFACMQGELEDEDA